MIDDLMKSTKESLLERLSSPLLGSFLVSWCLWNYKFLVILLSSATVTTTFKLIEQNAFPDLYTVVSRGIFFPMLTTAAYIFIYPYPARFVYGFTRRRQREINDLKRQIENETPLTLEESRAIRAEAFQLEQKHQQTIDRPTAEVTRLNAALEAGQRPTDKEKAPTRDEPQRLRLSPTQVALLQTLDKAGGIALESALINRSTEPKVKTQFDLGELQQLQLVHKNYDQSEGEYTYEFTHEGRRVYLAQSDASNA